MAADLFMPCCHCPITPKSCLLAPHWLLLNAAPLCLASWLLPLAPWLAPGYGRERWGRQSQVGVSTSQIMVRVEEVKGCLSSLMSAGCCWVWETS
ncbi:hypothetical protein V8C86DRAFT_2642335 [Haematococcus lacustris]